MLQTIEKKDIFGPTYTQTFVADWLVAHYGYPPCPSPLLDPHLCTKMMRDFHNTIKYRYSWGDYLAWRRPMWAGFYGHEEEKYYHLGIDVNVTAGTPISVDYDCEVVVVDTDHHEENPEPQGWGRRVIVAVRRFKIFLLYAHLSPQVRCRVGEKLRAGSVIGRVGMSRNNGGWYAHTHLQALTPPGWQHFHDKLHELDAYCSPQQLARMKEWCPDPAPYVQIP